MDRDRRLSLTVGGLVVVSLVAFAGAILSLSSQMGIWTPHYRLVGYFDNVGGLIGGAPVWLAGKRVGGVESVAFDTAAKGRTTVKVAMQIEETVRERIRSDSVASIGTIGLLGDVYVEISLGTTDGRMLADGDELSTIDPLDLNRMISKGAEALEQITSLTSNLNLVVSEFEQEEGGRSLADSARAFGDLIGEIQNGEGVLHSLVYDPYAGKSVGSAMVALEDILTEVAEGDGVIHSMLYDSPEEQGLVLEALEAGSRLNSILTKIDRGEGTFGLMLNDPTLYEEIKLLVGGAGRSRVVRALINLTTSGDD